VWIKKGGKGTDYVLPTELLVMMNVLLDFKNQVSASLSSTSIPSLAWWSDLV
jgi:hypothetical protein